MKRLSAFACGVVFALGLGISGMTQPSKILAFLDIAGAWDPTLLFVMGGAVLVAGASFPRILRRDRAVLGDDFALPTRTAIDPRLLIGAALFGVGWGLSGYCPGPAIVSLATGSPAVIVFVLGLVIGLRTGAWLADMPPASDTRRPQRPATIPKGVFDVPPL